MQKGSKVSLRTWIWRAFVQTALIPLILVETVLISIYLLTNVSIRDAQVNHLREMAIGDLQTSATQEAHLIRSELGHIARLTATYATLTQETLRDSRPVAPATLATSPNGVRYSDKDDGGSASFYSSATPLQQQDMSKVARLAHLDPFMRETARHNPLIASIYFNSWDNYNRIYPWFDTLHQYPQDMVIPDYNFYYLASPAHNPQRKVTWTDVYLDPAGQGWMLSSIAPVFRGDFLEGVVGLDITVGKLLEHIQKLNVPWDGYAMIVSQDMNIMALPPAGEDDFGLDELTTHSYDEAISSELFKPEDFNLGKRADTEKLAKAIAQNDSGVLSMPLNGRQHLVAWATIPATNWHLLTVVDEAEVFSQTNALANHYRNIGYLLIAGLVLFYLLFFAIMWGRTRNLSDKLKAPIAGIAAMLQAIGKGNLHPPKPQSDIAELEGIIADVQVMGDQLQRSSSQLQRASLEAQEASQAKSQFISSMSHELRTPLNAIQGFAQLMRMKSPIQNSNGEADYLEEILLASRHLNQLVGDILDWSRLQSERPRLELHPIDAVALMRECAELVEPEVSAHGLDLQLHLPNDPLLVLAEPRRLRQVLLNLLSNAIKYTPKGSVTLECTEVGDNIRLSVSDTGIGIPEELQPLLFEPFQRLGQENTAIQGTGIGLSLCKEYAALMQGQIDLHSEAGTGSCFWIELPRHRPVNDTTDTESTAAVARVYHADCDLLNRTTVQQALTDVSLEQFEDGQRLLDAMLSNPPDALLLSVELEGVDGREVLREVHRQPQFAGLPIILLCRPDQVEELISLGASALLAVPIDPVELHQLIHDLTHDSQGA
ncbi:ATP-binding protein [Pseudomonas berkeleyensis]|uniref:histidine kinase n=1 Tax=Pseudomonas berkeleyensis TaxID=2726956 RepID=A0A7G5DSU5_9PSED|nr:ATP-binding protein [Pseudomonas berkeleyensis]QMV64820.1 response regulator [Pseudomonas berkeleyensis]WSO40289.1 ATP-binding protein [Pseudomonas berkeleyensis]